MARIQNFMLFLTVDILRAAMLLYFKVAHRLEIRGKEHIPSKGPFLITPNHQSNYDGLLAGCPVPQPVHCMVMGKYFHKPFIGWFLRTFRGVPIYGARDRDAYRRTLKVLRAGHKLAIFPEGHRSRDGSMIRLQTGAARAALTIGAPMVPVSILGAFEAWPRHRALPRFFSKIIVEYHPPIPCEVAAREDLKRRALEVTEELDAVLRPPVEAWQAR